MPDIPIEDMLELIDTIRPLIYNVCFIGKLTASSIPFQFKQHKVWKGIGKGTFDKYYIDLLKELFPSLRRKYDIAEHTIPFCLRHKIKGCEVSYRRLPKDYQAKVLA